MSLSSQIKHKNSPVRQFFDGDLGDARSVCSAANAILRGGLSGEPPVPPLEGAEAGLVGTAVEFVLAAVGDVIREPLIAGASTAELADQRAKASQMAIRELGQLTRRGSVSSQALGRVADCALACARLEQRARIGDSMAISIGHPDPGVGARDGLEGVIRETGASEQTRLDLMALLEAAIPDTADLYRAAELYVDPTFALSFALGGADADLVADGVLVDFKSSRDRSVIKGVDIYQLLGYTLADLQDWYGIREVGIHALRWRTRWRMPVEDFLWKLSGARRPLSDWRQRFADVFPKDARAHAMRERRRPSPQLPRPDGASE